MTQARTYPHNFRGLDRARRLAKEQAARDGAPMAVVDDGDNYFVRSLTRALGYVAKHQSGRIVERFFPGVAA